MMKTLQLVNVTGVALDIKKQSSRPEFSFLLNAERMPNGEFTLKRSWYGVGAELVAQETCVWEHSGLIQAAMAQPHIHEQASASCTGRSCQMVLTSRKKQADQREKTVQTAYPAVTLLSVICDIAANWDSLLKGESLIRSYLVLKVQAYTGVALTASRKNGLVYIAMTPLNWFWRAIFGATEFVFKDGAPVLLAINGLIEPRDIARSGRYVEYLANCDLSEPVDLSLLLTSKLSSPRRAATTPQMTAN
jgi:hypothetical protein